MGVDQLDGTFKMILVSDNGCHIWTIAIRWAAKIHFLIWFLSNQTPLLSSLDQFLMRSFAKSFVFFITQNYIEHKD
jgi:hypothetical protein